MATHIADAILAALFVPPFVIAPMLYGASRKDGDRFGSGLALFIGASSAIGACWMTWALAPT